VSPPTAAIRTQTGTHLKRISPAASAVVIIAAFVLLADAAIVAVPTVAEVRTAASPTPAAVVAVAPATVASAAPETYAEDADATRPIFEGGPTATPTPRPTPRPTPKPTPRDTVCNARIWLKAQVGATQYACIYQLWDRESKWNPYSANKSGAYGIPQAYPGSKMAAFGSNWRYSPLTQVKWGLWYVNSRYGSGCQAWAFWQSHGWY
jgi:hypothetical protein